MTAVHIYPGKARVGVGYQLWFTTTAVKLCLTRRMKLMMVMHVHQILVEGNPSLSQSLSKRLPLCQIEHDYLLLIHALKSGGDKISLTLRMTKHLLWQTPVVLSCILIHVLQRIIYVLIRGHIQVPDSFSHQFLLHLHALPLLHIPFLLLHVPLLILYDNNLKLLKILIAVNGASLIRLV
jgi:hypothetical protein